jgi:DNA polymerase (family 10)
MEVVRNINLLLGTYDPQEVLSAFSKLPGVEGVQPNDEAGGCTLFLSGVKVDLRITSDQTFPHALFCFTGSLADWTSMLERGKGTGFKLSEEGLQRNGKPISCKEEEGVFNALGLDFIPPELRENRGEIEASEIHRLPRLITQGGAGARKHPQCHGSWRDESLLGTKETALNSRLKVQGSSFKVHR